jgi:NAD(P)-dependent dehydrogenase (short-subunit alcohol dehydrogenase family)
MGRLDGKVALITNFVTTRFATAYWRGQSKQAGGPVYGRIVNTSSEAFLLGSPGQPDDAAAKAGIAALTVTTARSCARYGVRANATCPRARTTMTADLMGARPVTRWPWRPRRSDSAHPAAAAVPVKERSDEAARPGHDDVGDAVTRRAARHRGQPGRTALVQRP